MQPMVNNFAVSTAPDMFTSQFKTSKTTHPFMESNPAFQTSHSGDHGNSAIYRPQMSTEMDSGQRFGGASTWRQRYLGPQSGWSEFGNHGMNAKNSFAPHQPGLGGPWPETCYPQMQFESPRYPQIQLPTLELPDFDGDRSKFNGWLEAFKVLVDWQPISALHKWLFVKQSVKDRAWAKIAGLTDSYERYPVAMQILCDIYGDYTDNTSFLLKQLSNLNPVDSNLRTLEEFTDTVRATGHALRAYGTSIEARDILVPMLINKLPDELIRKMEERRYMRSTDKSFRIGQKWSYDEFVTALNVEQQLRSFHSPSFSIHSVSTMRSQESTRQEYPQMNLNWKAQEQKLPGRVLEVNQSPVRPQVSTIINQQRPSIRDTKLELKLPDNAPEFNQLSVGHPLMTNQQREPTRCTERRQKLPACVPELTENSFDRMSSTISVPSGETETTPTNICATDHLIIRNQGDENHEDKIIGNEPQIEATEQSHSEMSLDDNTTRPNFVLNPLSGERKLSVGNDLAFKNVIKTESVNHCDLKNISCGARSQVTLPEESPRVTDPGKYSQTESINIDSINGFSQRPWKEKSGKQKLLGSRNKTETDSVKLGSSDVNIEYRHYKPRPSAELTNESERSTELLKNGIYQPISIGLITDFENGQTSIESTIEDNYSFDIQVLLPKKRYKRRKIFRYPSR